MFLCIIILAAAARLAWTCDTQFQSRFLVEMCSGLVTTVFLL